MDDIINIVLSVPKNNAVQVKWIFNDSGGRRSGTQNILLGGQIVGRLNTRHVFQIAEPKIVVEQIVFKASKWKTYIVWEVRTSGFTKRKNIGVFFLCNGIMCGKGFRNELIIVLRKTLIQRPLFFAA